MNKELVKNFDTVTKEIGNLLTCKSKIDLLLSVGIMNNRGEQILEELRLNIKDKVSQLEKKLKELYREYHSELSSYKKGASAIECLNTVLNTISCYEKSFVHSYGIKEDLGRIKQWGKTCDKQR